MAFPLIPVALGGSALALLLLAKKPSSASNVPKPLPDVNPNKGGGGGGRKQRPDPFPPGAGEAIVTAPLGIIARKGPGTNNPMIAPEGQSPNDAFTGTHVAVFQTGVPPTDGQGGEWWLIETPGGGIGYARGVDAKGVKNFNLITPPAANVDVPEVVAGARPMPYRPFSVNYDTVGKSNHMAKAQADAARRAGLRRAYARFSPGMARIGATGGEAEGPSPLATCTHPTGIFLRPSPGAPGMFALPPGAKVLVDDVLDGPKREAASPNAGGWAKVRYFGNGMTAPVSGFVLSEWLTPSAGGPPAVIGRASVAPWARRF